MIFLFCDSPNDVGGLVYSGVDKLYVYDGNEAYRNGTSHTVHVYKNATAGAVLVSSS